VIAFAYVIVFVVQLPRNITELAWDSDYSTPFTIAEAVARRGSEGATVLASRGDWVSLWFGLLTAKLPLHRQLWAIAPTALFIATALIVGWSVTQVANRRAGAFAALLAVVVSPLALAFFLAAAAHNTVYPCTALAGAYLIWLTRGEGRRTFLALSVPVVLGVVLGTCVASDLLNVVTALVPLGLTAILAGVRRERRSRIVAISAIATVAVAVPIAKLTTSIMHASGFTTIETPAKVVPLSELWERAQLLFKGLKALFNGYLASSKGVGPLHTELGIASIVIMSAALLTVIVIGARYAITLIRSGLRKGATDTPRQLARSLHVIYWSASAACACGAFWLAAETGGGTNLHESYYATTIFSVAAVVPLVLSVGALARRVVLVGAAVFFAASLVGMTGNYLNLSPWIAQKAPIVTRLAEANHVSYGYAGYGAAASLTWNTHRRVTVRPVLACENPQGANVCEFYETRVPFWYVPQQRHTFLLVDREEPFLSQLPSGLGRPIAAYSFGAMSMYIYPYDIASRLGPPPY
jgi:MFS family permease